MRPIQIVSRVTFLTAALMLPGGAARAADFYYLLIFGSQDSPKHLKYTHTWATFVHAVGEGLDANSYAIEAHTISWLPRNLDVKVLSLRPEPGVNLDLTRTLHFVQSQGESTTLWGPFQIRPELYARSLEIHRIIDSGAVQYRAISNAENLFISDCIHAVAAVDPDLGRGQYPLIRIGKPASRYIARQVRTRTPYDQDQTDHSWLVPRLGLDRRAIEVVPPSEVHRLPFFLAPRRD